MKTPLAALFALAAAMALVDSAPIGSALADPVQPGTLFSLAPEELPEPYHSESVGNSPDIVARPEGMALRAPAGFAVNLYAENLAHPRNMVVAETGEVLLAETSVDRITRLVDRDGDGAADVIEPFAEGFDGPHGLAIHDGHVYVADLEGLWRAPYRAGEGAPGDFTRLTAPGAFGSKGGHWTRNLVIDADNERIFIAIGSRGNIAEEPEPRATIQAFDMEGGDQRTYASGLRNPVGMDLHPETGALYTVVNERDGLGDELVPDYLTRVEEGAFYGWPYAYVGSNPQPGYAERAPALVEKTRVPDLLFRSHSAPIGMTFYDGATFPAAYRGDAFVALRGSWNAAVPRGYMVVRVPFEDGRPMGHYEAFVTGFRLDEPGTQGEAEVWGRPAGVAVMADGSLLIADDRGGTLWRVSHQGE